MNEPTLTRRRTLGLGLGAAAALALPGCGGGADQTKARLRLVNASAYDALDMTVDDTKRVAAAGYGESASYAEVDPKHADTRVAHAGAATALVSTTPSLAKNRDYALLAYGDEGDLRTLLLDENTDAPAAGKALVRVVNAAPDAGELDVYLTGTNDALTDAVALQAAAGVGSLGSHATWTSGTWRLRVTGAQVKADLRLDVTITLPDRGVTTLVLTGSTGGVLVHALVLADRGAITRADNTFARVRLVGGVADGAAVTASVGGVALAGGANSPSVGTYQLVAAGSANVAATVNGSAVAPVTVPLSAGADYTLLVYGTAAVPAVSLIGDDNRLPPSSPPRAKVRLVNGVADAAGALSLKIDLTPVAGGVGPGSGSAYQLIVAQTSQVSVGSGGTALFSNGAFAFSAGAVYTVFALGRAAAQDGVVHVDR